MILHRYILGQILWPAINAFVSLNLLFLVIQLVKVAEVTMGAGPGPVDLFRVSLLFLPGFAVLTVPIAVLVGVLLGFGRMAQDGEMVALAGAGISGGTLTFMPMVLGLFCAGAAVLVANFFAPAAAAGLHREFVDLSKRYAAARLRPGEFFNELPGVVFYPRARGPAEGEWDGFLLCDRRSGREPYFLVSRSAQVRPREEGNVLDLELADGQVHAQDDRQGLYSLVEFARGEIGVNIDHLVAQSARFIPPGERMSLRELSAISADPRRERRERNLCATAWHRRFAFPAASLLFSLLGSALGATGRLRGRRLTLLTAVSVVAAYYLLTRLGDAAIEKGFLSPGPAAWLPNFLVAAAIAWMMARWGRRPG